MTRNQQETCTKCGNAGTIRMQWGGSFYVGMLLATLPAVLPLFAVAALIYVIWSFSARQRVCIICGTEAAIDR